MSSSSSDSDSPNFKTPSPPTPAGNQPPPPSIAVAATKAAAAASSSINSSVASSSSAVPPSSPPTTYIPQPIAVVDKESLAKAKSVTDALNKILSSSPDPSTKLLQDSTISSDIYTLLREPASGSGDNPLCRWLYDTFNLGSQSDPSTLHLVVLRFVPLLSGLYLSRASSLHSRPHLPLAGFEAVLLALYAHQTTVRNGQPTTITLPDLSNPSIYHDGDSTASPTTTATAATELNIAVISPALEPHGTVRSTRRARIVGVALELYYSKIDLMPLRSNLDFCEFVVAWAGGEFTDGEQESRGGGGNGSSSNGGTMTVMTEGKRIPLPWELLQPVLRILGHCLMGGAGTGAGVGDNNKKKDIGEGRVLYDKACTACRSLYARALYDTNPKAILATQSLLNVIKIDAQGDEVDYTDIPKERVINLSDP